MSIIARFLKPIFQPAQSVPSAYRRNFFHLYLDIAWYGVLSGTTLSFLVIYATRLGANGQQVGLLNAIPAVVTLLFAIPAGKWLSRRSIGGGVFWSSLIFRLFYLLFVPLPAFFLPQGQIWAIIAVTLVMNIPGTGLAVGMNALFAEAVPADWRGYVSGIRNAVYAVAATVVTIASGFILTRMEFPTGYQVVFALGFVGAVISSYHIGQVKPLLPAEQLPEDAAGAVTEDDRGKPLRAWLRRSFADFRLDILRGPFGKIVFLLFLFHFSQYLSIPIFPLFNVNELLLNDQMISVGSSLFNITTFVGSLQVARLARKNGNRRILGLGIILLGFYPGILSLATGPGLYLVASLVGGFAWSLVGGVLYNYMLESMPANDRPAYLAWYTLGLNAAILLGSMLGPVFAGMIGLAPALMVYAICRVLAGAAVLRWG